jgi:7-cyano-7-deazaguanine synthase in queuosine biosynthesis
MRRHSIIVRLSPADKAKLKIQDSDSVQTRIQFIEGNKKLSYGLGQMVDSLSRRGIIPTEVAVDLAILSATVTAADTRISRATESQDSWTREIDLYVPVSDPTLFSTQSDLIERILAFLTGDRWRIYFRPRLKALATLVDKKQLRVASFDSVCLFSGGLDSFVGAIDLLDAGRNPLLVSHYWENSTSSQEICAERIGAVYGDVDPRHVRARVGFANKLVKGSESETTTRGRSFLFFGMAVLAASGLNDPAIVIPENGLISLNVPLDPLRLGAWSTRTTHPFYLARWQELLLGLGLSGTIENPYRFMTKGEMVAACANQKLLRYAAETISCSSISKGRWKKLSKGHCGHCTPCLIRRASLMKGLGNDSTPYALSNLNGIRLDARLADSEHIRSFQLMAQRLGKRSGIEHVLVHKPGPLTDYSTAEIDQYGSVFKRGIEEVAAVISKVTVKP